MTPPSGGRVRIPSLTTRSALAWVIATGVVLLAVCAVVAATQAANRVPAGIGAVVVVVVGLALAGSRRYADVGARSLTWSRWGIGAAVARPEVQAVALTPNRAGSLTLDVRTARRTRRLQVVALTPYVRGSLPPPALLAIASVLDGEPPVAGGPAVVNALRQQADFLASGRPVENSPLAARIRR